MSCEPGRKAAYSSDIRNQIIWQRIATELPFRAIARNLSVSVGTVHSIYKLFEQTGSVNPRRPDRTSIRVLSQYDELVIIGFLMENPCLYSKWLCRGLVFTVEISWLKFFNIDQMVWLDETGCDKRDHVRKMGYAMKGEQPSLQAHSAQGAENISCSSNVF